MKNILAPRPAPSRKWKWLLGLGFLLAVAAGLGLWGRRPAPPPRPQPPAEAKSRMEGLSLTEIQEGDRRWVLDARKADFRKDKDEVAISGIGVEFFGPGEHVKVRADEGVFHTKSRVLTLKGQVEMQRGDLTIQTTQAVYQPGERILLAPEEVILSDPNLKVQGKGLRVELARRILVLAQHRLTEIKPKGWGLKP